MLRTQVAPNKQHRPNGRTKMADFRAPIRRTCPGKGAHHRSHSARSRRLHGYLVQKLLSNRFEVIHLPAFSKMVRFSLCRNSIHPKFTRFESTITAQFFGHTHFDELELFYPKEDPYRASSVA